jgi:hypothetical protein
VSERNDDEFGQIATFGFTRILQIVARGAPPQDVRVTEVSQPQPRSDYVRHPAWAHDLMCWLGSWHDVSSSSYPEPHPQALLQWRDAERRDATRQQSPIRSAVSYFWSTHETRVWQFPAPIELEEIVCAEESSMYWLHSFLTGHDVHYTAFSPSLRASSWQALGFGQDERTLAGDLSSHPLFARGTWDLAGYGDDEGVTASAVRALLPFYEPMRRAHRDRGKSSK